MGGGLDPFLVVLGLSLRREHRAGVRAREVLRVLENRGVPTPPEVRARIERCNCFDVFDRWWHRAFTVTKAEDIFDENN
ncbi:hypothetical protein I5Q34_18030 [Streptomyces sp. AV19]|nr:hypothetical protein [Streptomyces sp. AV19]